MARRDANDKELQQFQLRQRSGRNMLVCTHWLRSLCKKAEKCECVDGVRRPWKQ